jgi:hypothetical protein
MRIPFFSTTLSDIRPKLPSGLLDETSDEGNQIASRDEIFQYDASMVSIAAGALLRRSSLLFVHRGELRDLLYLPERSNPETVAITNSHI